jgi:hypothetical protein
VIFLGSEHDSEKMGSEHHAAGSEHEAGSEHQLAKKLKSEVCILDHRFKYKQNTAND